MFLISSYGDRRPSRSKDRRGPLICLPQLVYSPMILVVWLFLVRFKVDGNRDAALVGGGGEER